MPNSILLYGIVIRLWKGFFFMPVVIYTLWGRAIVEDMCVITMDDQSFFDDIMEHEQLGLTGCLKGDNL